MKKSAQIFPVTEEILAEKIYVIRGKKVMLDRDLARLYGVGTKVLNQAVKRNALRFPEDFMFQLTKEEMEIWKSQIVTSKSIAMGLRKMPLAFTEQGVAMLSGVLHSERAVQVNIQIMRMFVKLRQILESDEALRHKIDALEAKYDSQFSDIFTAIKQLLNYTQERKSRRKIGFNLEGSSGSDRSR